MGPALIAAMVALAALAAGILIGRYYVPDDRMLRRTAKHSRAYMRALSHLLARDLDAVVDELRRVVDENIDDAEPYFALAALFRARGEHERAIRVHQALAVREGQARGQRTRALYELGLDVRAAGMPRRAARAMEEVLTDEPRHPGALRALCGLYEEQGRYQEAAAVWQRLAKLHGEPPTPREHHLWVAAAQQALAAGALAEARKLLKVARKHYGDSPHLHVVAAELAAANHNPAAARERLREAIAGAPELARYLAPGLVAAERAISGDGAIRDELAGDDDAPAPAPAAAEASGPAEPALAVSRDDAAARRAAAATLEELAGRSERPLPILLARAGLLVGVDDDAAAHSAALAAAAAREPDALPTHVAAARAALASTDPAAQRAALAGLTAALGWTLDGRWRCTACGHRAAEFAWRCGACRRWAAAAIDLGGEPPARPRDRRERPRAGASALLGGAATQALPAPTLDRDVGLDPAPSRPGVLGRFGGWISGAWSGMRGRPRS